MTRKAPARIEPPVVAKREPFSWPALSHQASRSPSTASSPNDTQAGVATPTPVTPLPNQVRIRAASPAAYAHHSTPTVSSQPESSK
eukprot:5843266-Pleurochrysis_carterae.AAC.1